MINTSDAKPTTMAGPILLMVVMIGLLASTLLHVRVGGEALAAGEATSLMMASSLWEDGDLVYSREDFDRLLLQSGVNPTDLELVSGSEGREITFDRPIPHALWLAPFLALWPHHGFAVANGLLLALALGFAAVTWSRRIGAMASWWILVACGASVLPAYLFRASDDLFLFSLTLLAFCLVPPDVENRQPRFSRGLAIGALLAVPTVSHPLFLVLPLVAWAITRSASVRRALLWGLGASTLLLGLVQWWNSGGLFGFGSSSFRFRPETGYPLVDFTAAEWGRTVHRLAAVYWEGAPRFSWGLDPGLWFWDSVYLLLGRSIGLVPYFLPAFVLLAFGGGERERKRMALGVGLWALASILWFPFDLHGGEGAIANRRFLPLYGMLWLLAAAPRSALSRPTGRRLAGALALTVVLAAPFLFPLWSRAWAPPETTEQGSAEQGSAEQGSAEQGSAEQGSAYVSSWARALLPFETSQKWMPGGPVESFEGLRIKFLDPNAWAESRRRRLMIDGPRQAEMVVTSPERVDAFYLAFGKEAPARLEVRGAVLDERVLEAGGGIGFRIAPRWWTPRHATWWSPQSQFFYRFGIQLPGAPDHPLAFQLIAEREAEASADQRTVP